VKGSKSLWMLIPIGVHVAAHSKGRGEELDSKNKFGSDGGRRADNKSPRTRRAKQKKGKGNHWNEECNYATRRNIPLTSAQRVVAHGQPLKEKKLWGGNNNVTKLEKIGIAGRGSHLQLRQDDRGSLGFKKGEGEG